MITHKKDTATTVSKSQKILDIKSITHLLGGTNMSETIKTTEHYYTKEFNNYNNTEDNFVANQELTITITLNEYRKLIETSATKDTKIEEARSSRWKAERERDEAKKEIAELKNKIYELQNPDEEMEKN